jgi:hypothetical protein
MLGLDSMASSYWLCESMDSLTAVGNQNLLIVALLLLWMHGLNVFNWELILIEKLYSKLLVWIFVLHKNRFSTVDIWWL